MQQGECSTGHVALRGHGGTRLAAGNYFVVQHGEVVASLGVVGVDVENVSERLLVEDRQVVAGLLAAEAGIHAGEVGGAPRLQRSQPVRLRALRVVEIAAGQPLVEEQLDVVGVELSALHDGGEGQLLFAELPMALRDKGVQLADDGIFGVEVGDYRSAWLTLNSAGRRCPERDRPSANCRSGWAQHVLHAVRCVAGQLEKPAVTDRLPVDERIENEGSRK